MRTRTLLLLAVGCGLAILLAGGALLLQLVGQDEPSQAAVVGEAVRLGDMEVTVLDSREDAGTVTVEVDIGGVADDDGTAEFRLLVPTGPLAPEDGGCGATTLEVRRCALEFDLADTEGSSRVLLYRRGDERARWELGA